MDISLWTYIVQHMTGLLRASLGHGGTTVTHRAAAGCLTPEVSRGPSDTAGPGVDYPLTSPLDFPSTWAYIAHMVRHESLKRRRGQSLGELDAAGKDVSKWKVLSHSGKDAKDGVLLIHIRMMFQTMAGRQRIHDWLSVLQLMHEIFKRGWFLEKLDNANRWGHVGMRITVVYQILQKPTVDLLYWQ